MGRSARRRRHHHRPHRLAESLDADQRCADGPRQHHRHLRPFDDRLLTGVSIMRAVSVEEAVAMIPAGASIMVGGFMGVGTPERLLDEVVRQQKTGLSLISNDAATPGKGIGKLFDAALVSRLTATHIGLNPKVQQQMLGNQIAVDLVPQGTFVERIRAGGCGLGGVLTPTGVGTLVAEGKRQIEVDGKDVSARDRAAGAIRPGSRLSGRLPRQPHLRADRTQLQPSHGDGGRHRDRNGRTHRTRGCHRDPTMS